MFFFDAIRRWSTYRRMRPWLVSEEAKLAKWEAAGRPVPPPAMAKHEVIRGFAKRFGIRAFVETGTFIGRTAFAMKDDFDRIDTIELSDELFRKSHRRLSGWSHIRVWNGDSAAVLPSILSSLDEAAVFWLDAHYSEGVTARGDRDTPIMRELAVILGHPIAGNVVLIDDARRFVGVGDYPTLEVVRTFVAERRPALAFDVEGDIIRIWPPERC